MKIIVVYSFLLLSGVAVAAFVSHHGYRDLLELRSKIADTRGRIAELERQNEDLKRQVSLLNEPSEGLLARQVRDFLKWVKPNELVYIKKSPETKK